MLLESRLFFSFTYFSSIKGLDLAIGCSKAPIYRTAIVDSIYTNN